MNSKQTPIEECQNILKGNSKSKLVVFLINVISCMFSIELIAQELEPRSLTNLPTETHFVALGYGYSHGDFLLDPSNPSENLNAQLNTFVGAYVQSFDFFGKSSKFDFIIPWAVGNWDGLVNGIDSATSRYGLGDPRFRLSINFIGAPALNVDEYESYRQTIIVGFSIQIINPLGTYYPDKHINLGANRWVFKPQLGVSHKNKSWLVEYYLAIWLFGQNTRFYEDNKLNQTPLYAMKVHLIHSFKNKIWGSLGLGYAIGGKTKLNDCQRSDRISTLRVGTTLAIPINQQNTIKVSAFSGMRFEKGSDFESISFIYQYRWGSSADKKKLQTSEAFFSLY